GFFQIFLSFFFPSFWAVLLIVVIPPLFHARERIILKKNRPPAGGVVINVGDFNNDGILDLVTANANGTVSVFPGRADGTFAPPITSTTTGHQPNDLAFGDFNKDGKLDVAVSNVDSNTVQILLGNGDG